MKFLNNNLFNKKLISIFILYININYELNIFIKMPTFKNANLAQIIFLEKLMTITREDNKIKMDKFNRIIREAVIKNKDKMARKLCIGYNKLLNDEKQISRDLNNLKIQKLIKMN